MVQIAQSTAPAPVSADGVIDAAWLRQVCLDSGADDVGFVELARPALEEERPHLVRAFPPTRSPISFVLRMNRENVRSPARSIANSEFHESTDEANHVARRITAALERAGVRALNPPSGFPMEADRWMTERLWVVAHKPVAVAAGLGRMGIHRNVIHPRFGNFLLLGTALLGAEVSAYNAELDYNPCLTCKLCVAACPVGAIGPDGAFNFSACVTHNYHDFMGGFANWAETLTESRGRRLSQTGAGNRDDLDLAKPGLRTELQGCLLHGSLSRGRGRDRAVSALEKGLHRRIRPPAPGENGKM